MLHLSINGRTHGIEADPMTPLLWVIREHVGLTGTKYGCGIGVCGACTVHIAGDAVRSCMVSARDVAGAEIVTIEGLAVGDNLSKPQRAWVDQDVPQCGYCQSGMIMAAAALLNRTSSPTDDQINEAVTNICRCGTYQQVRQAIHDAAKA